MTASPEESIQRSLERTFMVGVALRLAYGTHMAYERDTQPIFIAETWRDLDGVINEVRFRFKPTRGERFSMFLSGIFRFNKFGNGLHIAVSKTDSGSYRGDLLWCPPETANYSRAPLYSFRFAGSLLERTHRLAQHRLREIQDKHLTPISELLTS